MKPSDFKKPILVEARSTYVTIQWSQPVDIGGCAITTYEIYIDDANGGALTKVHASDLDDKPEINSFTITDLPTANINKPLRV